MVTTTAGFDLGPHFDMTRVDFHRSGDRMKLIAKAAEGNLARQEFAPYMRGDDGVTITIWRDDVAMMAFAYKPGHRRDEAGRHEREKTVDRTSFTRLRPLKASGTWQGSCPVEMAGVIVS